MSVSVSIAGAERVTSKPPHGGGGHAPHQAPPHRSAAPHSAHGGRTASKAGPLPVPPPPSTKPPRSPRAALEPETRAAAQAPVAAGAPSAGDRRQRDLHGADCCLGRRRRRALPRQAALRSARAADAGQGGQYSARARHPRYRRSIGSAKASSISLGYSSAACWCSRRAAISSTANTSSPRAQASPTWSTPSSKTRWCSTR